MANEVPRKTSRRSFLKKGLLGSSVLLLGGSLGLALFPSKRVGIPTSPLFVCDAKSFQVLIAFAARVIPPGGDAVRVAHAVDSLLRYAPIETQADLNKFLGLFENALPGFLLDQRVLPFTRLSPESQDAVLENWRSSKLALRRTGYQSFRKLCLGAHYAFEANWPSIGYPAPPAGINAMAYEDSMFGTPEWIEAQRARSPDALKGGGS